jgi:hypothetical protein
MYAIQSIGIQAEKYLTFAKDEEPLSMYTSLPLLLYWEANESYQL